MASPCCHPGSVLWLAQSVCGLRLEIGLLSPKGAVYLSPGRRPGSGRRTCFKAPALKGRATSICMGPSLSKLHLHFVFSSKHREPLRLPPRQGSLNAHWATFLTNQDSPAVKIGGASHHVHILSGGLVSTPFQGWVSELPPVDPGRCPGLEWIAPSGLANVQTVDPGRCPGLGWIAPSGLANVQTAGAERLRSACLWAASREQDGASEYRFPGF